MCGICGFLNLDGSGADPELSRRMISRVRHRGPDGSGVFTDGPASLAHARLSIIDLAGGHQPMHNEDRSVWITFNGEIFNFVELHRELLQRGHQFSTRCDTEVILHSYEDKGEDCVRDFNGQWSFAIWDAPKRRLFLSRDRLGVRPLFYTFTDKAFVFGSEIKNLLAHPGVSREIDLEALNQIFTFWFTLSPRTIFKNIFELPPGHSLVLENGKIRIQRHWQLDFSGATETCPDSPQQEKKYVEELRELLLDATRIRLRADVPVGAYLSGGLDSSIVTTLIRKFTDTSLETFSVAFEDPEFDESEYQQEVIRALGTKHQQIRCGPSDIARIFPDVIWHAEKPILRTAPAPMFLLSKLVRDSGYKVVLTGEGSDEFLGGYDIYKETKIRAFWASQPDSKLRPLLLKSLYPYMPGIQNLSPAFLGAFFGIGLNDPSQPFFSHLPRWESTSKVRMFFSEATKSELRNCDVYAGLRELLPAGFGQWTPFCRAQYLEGAFFLPGYLLSSQGDRVAMAHSVEGRYPFLDHRVVGFASKLPLQLKMKVLNEKYLLKETFGDQIPAAVRNRPKQPYRAPDAHSFINPASRAMPEAYVEDLLSPERIKNAGIFDPAAVSRLVSKIKTGGPCGFRENSALVGILSTQLVIHQFIENSGEGTDYAAVGTRNTTLCR